MPFKKKLFGNVRLLYVEDDADAREHTASFLRAYFKEVISADNGETALALYRNVSPDMILTDLRMPCMDGIKMSRIIRETDPGIPIVILSAHCDASELLPAVKLKLDDYLLKPFSRDILLEALARSARSLPFFSKKVYDFGDGVRYVFAKKSIVGPDTTYPLTHHESDLLELFICKEGEIVTYEEIETYVYKGEYMSPDAIKTLVKKLRKKVPDGRIINIISIGYQLR